MAARVARADYSATRAASEQAAVRVTAGPREVAAPQARLVPEPGPEAFSQAWTATPARSAPMACLGRQAGPGSTADVS
jgi:hypothetical protein